MARHVTFQSHIVASTESYIQQSYILQSYILKKKSLKHIDMGSSFEDLVVTSPAVKTESHLDIRFELENISKF